MVSLGTRGNTIALFLQQMILPYSAIAIPCGSFVKTLFLLSRAFNGKIVHMMFLRNVEMHVLALMGVSCATSHKSKRFVYVEIKQVHTRVCFPNRHSSSQTELVNNSSPKYIFCIMLINFIQVFCMKIHK